MSWKTVAIIGIAAFALTGCGTTYSIAPIPDASQQVRYERGSATVFSEKQLGAVQVTPLGVNGDDRVGFGIAVFNKSGAPANFGTENLSLVQQDGSPGKVMTSIELEHEAKVKAGWAEFAVALAAGMRAYAASQSAVSTTTGTAFTPVGPVSYYSQTYNPALAQANMEIASVETHNDLQSIQTSLDRSVSEIRDRTLQTTTVNPGESYGGIAVVDELSSSTFPQDVTLHVSWNGEDHMFRFTIAKGTAAAVQQASKPLPAPVTTQPMSIESKLPYGHVTNPEPESRQAQAPEAPAPMSYAQWQAKSGSGKPAKTSRTHQAATIVGAVE